MKKTIILLTMIAISIINCGMGIDAPKAMQGELDLTSWNFEKKGNVNLDGEWFFYHERLYEPADFAENRELENETLINVPDGWNSFKVNGKKIPPQTYGTYRLVIKAQTTMDNKALYINSIGTAYKIWINGRYYGEVGSVGTKRGEYQPQSYPKIITLEGNCYIYEVIIQAANFTYKHGGLWASISFGTSKEMQTGFIKEAAFSMFLAGSIFIIGLYHIVIYLMRRKDFAPLFFSLVCFEMAVRVFITSPFLFVIFGEGLDYDLKMKLEYLSFFIGVPFVAGYFYAMFPRQFPKNIFKIVFYIGLSACGITIFLPIGIINYFILLPFQIFTMIMSVLLVILIIMAAVKKEYGANILAIFLIFFLGTVLNDILNVNGILYNGYYVSLGIMVFIFGQAVLLAMRFTNAFATAEHLSEKLAVSNERLKTTVETLEVSRVTLIKSEKMATIGRLAGSINHEIKNPLGAIITNAELLKMDVEDIEITAKNKYIIENIKEEAEVIALAARQAKHVILNMLDYSREDSGDKRKVDLSNVIEAAAMLLKKELMNSNVELVLNVSRYLFTVGSAGEITQVLINLIINARDAVVEKGIKGGFVTIKAFQDEYYVFVEIEDNGIGIKDDDKKRMFEEYFTTKKSGEGTGLGMSVSKALLKKNNADIDFESVYNEGTKFTIRFRKTV